MATRKTWICLNCSENQEFERYVDAWRHSRDSHDGDLFLDTRIRVK